MAACAMGGAAVSAAETETKAEAETTATEAAAEVDEDTPVVESVDEAVEALGVEAENTAAETTAAETPVVTTEAAAVTVAVANETTTAAAVTTTEAAPATVAAAATTLTVATMTKPAATTTAAIQTTVFVGENQGVAPTNYYDDVVLMLDVSSSMWGDPMDAMKDAAVDICEKFLQADPGTVISVVAFGSDVESLRYSSDYQTLASYIQSLRASGGTNMYGGMQEVKLILDGSNGQQKSVIIMADGMPGYESSYTIDYGYDSCQNAALEYDNFNLKTSATVYSIGFFEDNHSDTDAQFIRDLASDPQYGYIVNNAADLDGVFTTIFQNISNTAPATVTVATATTTTVSVSSSPKTGDVGVGILLGVMVLAGCTAFVGVKKMHK